MRKYLTLYHFQIVLCTIVIAGSAASGQWDTTLAWAVILGLYTRVFPLPPLPAKEPRPPDTPAKKE